MPELLIELLSEEIPARMQVKAAEDLKRLVCGGLKANGLTFTDAKAHSTPRRLALVVNGVPEKQPDVSEERRGPPAGALEKAREGFRKSLPEGAVVEERETPKGAFLFAKIEKKGERTSVVLASILLHDVLHGLIWPKSMRWGAGPESRIRWVRPLHGILAVFQGQVFGDELKGSARFEKTMTGNLIVSGEKISLGNVSHGHRFMAPEPFEVSGFADYQAKLRAAYVILDRNERKAGVLADARALCDKAGVVLKDDANLLEEVAGLVEWPVVLMGGVDAEFMELPDEVLSASMRKHQKYFSTLDTSGKLAPRFIVVANRETADGGARIVAGNERVLRARLADAKFFWDQDRKTPLEAKLPRLEERVFHAKLGSVAAKAERVTRLAEALCEFIPGADKNLAARAARLAKADLSTGMVGEFADLQGVMGGYYARHDGEAAEVAQAVAEHYSPLGPGDACPAAPTSVAVSLADKLDTLVGFFAIDEKPTGSKDPFALRRAALGVIRLVTENELRLPLTRVLMLAGNFLISGGAGDRLSSGAKYTLEGFPPPEPESEEEKKLHQDLLAFFADRLKAHLKETGVSHDKIDAVFSRQNGNEGGEDDLARLLARIEALGDFLKTDAGENLLAAYRRAANILKIEEKRDGTSYAEAPDAGRLAQAEEVALYEALAKTGPDIEQAVAEERFADAMAGLARLRAPVDAFFDGVTVNADDRDVRVNRLKLLSMIRGALEGVADFSKIEG